MATNINNPVNQPTVLIAPLDWGLGHATRCIPLIKELLQQNFNVLLAAEKAGAALLQQEFPLLTILPLKGYNVTYSKTKAFFLIKIFSQLFNILSAIKYEHAWLKKTVAAHKINIVISDNRFGLYNKNALCIFITHQLFIKTGNNLLNYFTQLANYSYINKFNHCWVPDVAGASNVGGELSHPKKMPLIPTTYIGLLSRFKKIETTLKTVDVLVVLSGPEPQRTIFENMLLPQLQKLDKKTMLVRGLPKDGITITYGNVHIVQHLSATDLNTTIQQADVIITRCGYSTIMDLATINKQAIVVPTPGQTEQEYLAKYLASKNYIYTTAQHNFSVHNAINNMKKMLLVPVPIFNDNMLMQVVQQLKLTAL